MKKVIIGSLLFASSLALAAKSADMASKFVPNSKVVHETSKEVKMKTDHGSLIDIEFGMDGAFNEASGTNVDKDVFNPPDKMLTLKDAVAAAKKAGKNPVGKWSLEKGTLTGWAYEFQGFENGKEMEYVIDAKSGELKKAKKD